MRARNLGTNMAALCANAFQTRRNTLYQNQCQSNCLMNTALFWGRSHERDSLPWMRRLGSQRPRLHNLPDCKEQRMNCPQCKFPTPPVSLSKYGVCRTCARTNNHPDFRDGRHRQPDRPSSVKGAQSVAYRAGTQKARLLDAYQQAYPLGLTDDEAAVAAGLPLTSCYWKRCGELRQDNMILPGRERKSRHSGETRIECTYNPERGK